jgi:hypothetical protein
MATGVDSCAAPAICYVPGGAPSKTPLVLFQEFFFSSEEKST